MLLKGQEPSIRKKHFNLDNGIALSGYDAVAYLNQSKAIKGSKIYAVIHEGVTYYFSSINNKEEFKKNPAKYEPAYGGWCAYVMGSDGEKVSVDPKTFKIVNGRLNLFYNRFLIIRSKTGIRMK
jgi:YHS domain-containing protein